MRGGHGGPWVFFVTAAFACACTNKVVDGRVGSAGGYGGTGADSAAAGTGGTGGRPTEGGAAPAEPDAGTGAGPCQVPESLAATGGTVEIIRMSQAGASVGTEAMPPGTSAIPIAVDQTTLVSFFSPDGTLRSSSWLETSCPTSCVSSMKVWRVPSEVPTIQAALDQAAFGDTVYVEPGVYTESLQLHSGVRLVGAGAHQTVLTAGGASMNLIDFSGAYGVTIRGLRLEGTHSGPDCADPDQVLDCAGDWYRAAIYADGHSGQFGGEDCTSTSAYITQNVISGNDLGVVLYFLSRAVVRNNIFVQNEHALVLNHFHEPALVAHNVFYGNAHHAIASDYAYMNVYANLVVGSSVGFMTERPDWCHAGCNFFQDVLQIDAPAAVGANVEPAGLDFRLSPGSPAIDQGCFFPADIDGSPTDLGAYGDLAGGWYGQTITA